MALLRYATGEHQGGYTTSVAKGFIWLTSHRPGGSISWEKEKEMEGVIQTMTSGQLQ